MKHLCIKCLFRREKLDGFPHRLSSCGANRVLSTMCWEILVYEVIFLLNMPAFYFEKKSAFLKTLSTA